MWEGLRKFGPEHCDLPTMLQNVAFFLRILTLNIDSRNTQRIPVIFYITTTVAALCYFYVYLVSTMWFVFRRCAETGDMLAALVILSLAISSEIGMTKLIYMFLHLDKVKEIVAHCLACDALVEPNSRFSENLLYTLKLVKKRAIIFWLVIIMNGVIYVVKPICLPGRHFMEDLFVVYGLEPMYESPNYEIAFFLMTIGVCVTCYLPANITAFLIVVTGYAEAQLLAWAAELRQLWPDARRHAADSHTDTELAVNDYIRQKLKVIISGHANNILLMRQLEDAFRGAIAVEFSLLVMGLIAELLGGLENTYIQVPFALMQVAMDCLTGQRVMDASEVFERAVYDCKWEDFDKNNRKIVLLMLQNSQKTMTLSAGGIAKLSFACLMSVIRSIYSAYTTLRTTMNKT